MGALDPIEYFVETDNENVSKSGGGTATSFDFSTSDTLRPIGIGGLVAGGPPDGFAWFTAEADLSGVTGDVAWISIEGEHRTNAWTRWNIISVTATAGGVTVELPVRPLALPASTTYSVFVLPKVAHTVGGQSLLEWVKVNGNPTIEVRVRTERFANGATSTATDLNANIGDLGVRYGVMPETPDAFTMGVSTGAYPSFSGTLGPGSLEEPGAYRVNSAVVTLALGGVTFYTEHVAAVGDIVAWQYPGVLPYSGGGATIDIDVFFGTYAGNQIIENVSGSISTAVWDPSPGALSKTYTPSGTQVTVAVAQDQAAVTRSDLPVWEPIVQGPKGTGHIASFIDYPPLNTPVVYTFHRAGGGANLSLHSEPQTERTFVSSVWRLTDRATDTDIALTGATIREEWASTTRLARTADDDTLQKGRIADPSYTASIPIVTKPAYDQILAVLASDNLILRGPLGQWAKVQPVGNITVTDKEALTSISKPADGDMPVVATVQVNLAPDPR